MEPLEIEHVIARELGIKYDGVCMGVLPQFTILSGVGIGASFVVDLRTEQMTMEVVRDHLARKKMQFCII